LLKSVTEAHPDVKRMRNMMAVAVAERDRLAAVDSQKRETPVEAKPDLGRDREILGLQNNIRSVQTAIEAKKTESAGYEKQMKDLSGQINMISARVTATPVGDQMWSELIREEMMAKDEYMKMDAKLRAAQVAVDLEGRAQGEKLEVLDTANLPEYPTSPNRPMWVSVGAGLGLVIGVVLAGAREMKDTSLKNLKDVRAYTQMAILGSVPLLENDFVVRRRKRIAWLGWTVACLTAALVMAGSVVYYYATKS
jgi:uncharacterized protein involved in exopolysaccharide biosynthesis